MHLVGRMAPVKSPGTAVLAAVREDVKGSEDERSRE